MAARVEEIGGACVMRVARRCSLRTMPRRRNSAMPAATVPGLRPTCAASLRTDGSCWPGRSAPLATPASTLLASSSALDAWIVYCSISDV